MRERFVKRGRIPSPEEIRRECERIRRGWTEKERRERRAQRPTPWRVPVVAESCFALDNREEESE